MKHDIYYPVRLLTEMGIEPKGKRKTIPRVFFAPIDAGHEIPKEEEGVSLHSLSNEDRETLLNNFRIPPDRPATFTEMERDAYRNRYPLAKPKEVQIDVLKKVAYEYAHQGIMHAEVSYAGLDNPDTIGMIHEAMAQMEDENREAKSQGKDAPYAGLSFLFGIPRTFSPEKITNMLERAKIIGKSPYITGIDFIGYETNKTRDLATVLEPFLAWAQAHNPNFILRVHAGENSKNRANVGAVLELAERYHIATRVGHAIYGLRNEATLALAEKLAKKDLVTIELNPASNIALNNIDDLHTLPFKTLTKRDIPFVIGSDSGGMYSTTAEQLGLAGYYGGLTAEGFDKLAAHQSKLIEKFQQNFAMQSAAIPEWESAEGKRAFAQKLVEELRTVPTVPIDTLKKDFSAQRAALAEQGKLLSEGMRRSSTAGVPSVQQVLGERQPIAIVGASGSSWRAIENPTQRQQIAVAIDMLIHTIDPEKTYILQGRSKDTGLGKLIHESVKHANAQRPDGGAKLDTVGMIAAPQYGRQQAFDNLDHLIEIEGGLFDVADRIVNHVVKGDGVLVAAGGSAFTRDIILKADRRMVSHAQGKLMLMDCGNHAAGIGASSEKAAVLHPHYRIAIGNERNQAREDGRQILQNIHRLYPDIFPETFDPYDTQALDAMVTEAKERIAHYQLDKPDTKDQNVETGETLNRGRGIGES
jgi:adenosine deaminase